MPTPPRGEALRTMMDRLPIDAWEAGLYERLLDAPHALFRALLAGILRGEWSAHDLVPLLPEAEDAEGGDPSDDIRDALLAKIRGGRHPLETTLAAANRERAARLAEAGAHSEFADWTLPPGTPRFADSAWAAGKGRTDAERKRSQLEGARLAGPA